MIRRRDRHLLTTRHWPLTPDTVYMTGTFKHRESRNKPATFSRLAVRVGIMECVNLSPLLVSYRGDLSEIGPDSRALSAQAPASRSDEFHLAAASI
jgi:hypothetical protein